MYIYPKFSSPIVLNCSFYKRSTTIFAQTNRAGTIFHNTSKQFFPASYPWLHPLKGGGKGGGVEKNKEKLRKGGRGGFTDRGGKRGRGKHNTQRGDKTTQVAARDRLV